MLFNSLEFIIFFIGVTTVYFLIPHRLRWILLLGSSYYFYGSWNSKYLILIIISTLIDYFAGIMMGEEEEKDKRRKYLILSLISNLGMLFVFKYFNFFIGNINEVFKIFSLDFRAPGLRLLLPVGISFYTFQTLSYTFDVYRGTRKAEKHLGLFATYVAFFPQLVAGPIESSTNLLPQFKKKMDFDYIRMTEGLKFMIWGLFKKVVVADRTAIVVNNIYNDVNNHSGLTLLVASVFFGFQIYCDFSGYSDIAIGSAKVLGFDLIENFKIPYYSKSISEFWRRWHISLGKWFKDYLYISLGGNKVSKYKLYKNLMIVFLVSGLWHGASWNFIIWGALHGFYIVIDISTRNQRKEFYEKIGLTKYPRLKNFIHVGCTFSLVTFSWIFFRANTLKDALYIITHIFSNIESYTTFNGIYRSLDALNAGKVGFVVTLLSIGIMELFHLKSRSKKICDLLKTKPTYLRWSVYYSLMLWMIMFGVFEGASEFIYFQF
jgi:D-alanyl-lipoteichoic acid acyltransferase DltB (MBOAT superfamily)